MAEKKEKVSTLKERLFKHPYTSNTYRKTLKELAKRYKDQYEDQAILCVPRDYIPANGITELYTNDISDVLKQADTFVPKSPLQFLPRYEVEYDMAFNQVMVFGYITDETRKRFTLLKKKNKEITFIGGHVDFCLDAYTTPLDKYLELSLQKELKEEIKTTVEIGDTQINSKYFINSFDTKYDQFNMGIVYEIVVDTRMLKLIKSGEPSRHDIITFESKGDILKKPDISPWVRSIFEYENYVNIDTNATLQKMGLTLARG